VRFAWLSLDEGDSDPARFLAYLAAALQKIKAGIGESLQPALQSPQPLQLENILTTLSNEICEIQADFLLVLDDYHAIDSTLVDQALAFLIAHQPPTMRLAIATREDPDLPLARLRARGQCLELRAADLRFTPAETAEFLNQTMKLQLSERDIAALEERTEGWIAGLQMAALSMQGLADVEGFIRSFTGSHRFVMDYLLEETLNRQPENIQSFLLFTSILDRMCGSLCDALLADSSAAGQSVLETLERSNLFIIPQDNERRWYRYHHLFADLLRQRLSQTLAHEDIAGLHIRASQWYEDNQLAFEAFRHAAAASDLERAERLVESEAIGLHLRSVAIPALDWLTSLPRQALDTRPRLWVRSATLSLMAGRAVGAEERLQAAEAVFAAQTVLHGTEPDDQTRDLIGQIACARATLALLRYDPAAMIIQARRASEYLSPDNLTFRFTASWALTTALMIQGDRLGATRACLEGIAISQKSGHAFSKILAAMNMGSILQMDTQLYQAAEAYRQVFQLSGGHPQPSATTAYLGMARISYEWNDLTAAEQFGQQSLQLAQQFDRSIDRFIISEVFLACLKLAGGDVTGAAEMLAQTEQTARQNKYLLRLPEIAAAQVLILLRQDQVTAAVQLVQQLDLPLCHARALIAQEDLSAALRLLETYRQEMETKGWQDERLRAITLQAVALHLSGDTGQALATFDEALRIAEPNGFVRLFLDEGAPMKELLSLAAGQAIRPDYVGRLLRAFDAEPVQEPAAPAAGLHQPQAGSALSEPLSPRELEILRLLARGLSNREICERLFLALDTVKGHNRKIFDKLHVKSRSEAIARAHELDLL